MKKLICLVVAVVLSNCQIKIEPNSVNAQGVVAGYVDYEYKEVTIKGMTYGVWAANAHSSQASAIQVVNLTKDELEVKLLRKQLER